MNRSIVIIDDATSSKFRTNEKEALIEQRWKLEGTVATLTLGFIIDLPHRVPQIAATIFIAHYQTLKNRLIPK